MITIKTIIAEIEHRFPSFEIDEDFKEEPIIIGGELKKFMAINLEQNTPEITGIVNFVNELVESTKVDAKLISFLSEITIGLYDPTDKSNYYHLYNLLSPESQKYFDEEIALWVKGNNNAE